MSSHTYRDKQFLDFPFSKFYGQADFDVQHSKISKLTINNRSVNLL